MSDFMKSIVAEVLARNHSAPPAVISVSAPAPVPVPITSPPPAGHSCSAASQADCPSTCAGPGDCSKPPGGIKRINYQKEQAGKRLALLGPPGASPAAAHLPDAAAQPQSVVRSQERPDAAVGPGISPARTVQQDHPGFAERCLSPLLLRTLPSGGSQSSVSTQSSSPAGAQRRGKPSAGEGPRRSGGPPEAGRIQLMDAPERSYARNTASPDAPVPLIADGSLEAWLFPVISSRLRWVLGTAGRSCSSAGVLSVPFSHPGQLFAAEELLSGEPALEADIDWSSSGSFELKLFGNDSGKLARLLTELAGTLQRDSARRIRVYASLQPGPLLRRHLAAGQQDAVAIIDAASRWCSIGLAEQLIGSYPDAGLTLRAERSYCIVSGTSARLAAILPGLTGFADNQQ